MKRYSIWAHPRDTELEYLKSVEHKWELGGFLLGPIWILIKKGQPLLALLILAMVITPFFIFGFNAYTIFWAVVLWTINARSHVGLQAMRLKSMSHVRLGDVSANSHQDAQEQYRQSAG